VQHGNIRKITLKASQQVMEQLEKAYCSDSASGLAFALAVHDAGHTQVPAGSLTCVAFFPSRGYPAAELQTLKLY